MMTKKMKRGATAPLCVSAIAWMAAASVTVAQTNELPPVVVEASRTSQSAMELPSQVTLIMAEEIARSGAADTVQALERMGGLYFRKINGNPAQAEPVMGGFGENAHGRVLVLVDGQPLNQPDMAPLNWTAVPVHAIERIEILHGAQTALYGNYAIGGVVNIITKKDAEPCTSLAATVGSDDTYGSHFHHSGKEGDIRYLFDLDWQKSGGWRDNSDYKVFDARGRVQYDFGEGSFSWISLFYNHGSMGLPGPLTKEQMKNGPRRTGGTVDWTPYWGPESLPYADDEMDNTSFGGTLGTKVSAENNTFEVALAAQRRKSTSFMPSSSDRDAEIVVDSFALTPQYQWDGNITGHRNILTAGADFRYDQLEAKFGVLDLWAWPFPERHIGDGTLERYAVAPYARNEFFLKDDEISFIVGARWEYVKTDFNANEVNTATDTRSIADNSNTAQKQAYEAALLYRPEKNQKYYGRVTSLYRYPFMDEIAIYQGGAPGFSPALKPERGLLLEAGATIAPVDELTFDARIYRLTMRDEIAWNNTAWRNVNRGKTSRDGIDLATTWAPEDYGTLTLAYHYVNPEFADGSNKGKRIPQVPKHVFTLDGGVNIIPDYVTLLGTWRMASTQYLAGDDVNKQPRISGFGVADVGVRLTPVDRLSIIVSCDNVLDKTYATSGNYMDNSWSGGAIPDWLTYFPANGRTWRVTGRYQF